MVSRIECRSKVCSVKSPVKSDHADDQMRRFASRYEDIARAATEGYDVAGAVVDRIALEFTRGEFETRATIVRQGTSEFSDLSWVERTAPHASTLALRDRVLARANVIDRPSCVLVLVSRVMRVEETVTYKTPSKQTIKDKEKFTAILVTLSCVLTVDRIVIIRAE
jgi:hypothetical protein